MSEHMRINADSFMEMIENLPVGERERINKLQREEAIEEHNRFKERYEKDECYLCGKPFRTISKSSPCIHWLLRKCKFKAKDFSKIYSEYDFHQISAYLRWVANQERFQGNINDLMDERDERKIFEVTIKWKNIEWTFNCSENDYLGHKESDSNYPHYHFQMRIDKKRFINFNQHHIPFSEKDLFNFDLIQEKPDSVRHTYGIGGTGMQDAVEVDSKLVLDNLDLTESEENATYHLNTTIMARDSSHINGEVLKAMFEESRNTGKPVASLVGKYLGDSANIQTVISPVDTVPDIAKRSGRKKKI